VPLTVVPEEAQHEAAPADVSSMLRKQLHAAAAAQLAAWAARHEAAITGTRSAQVPTEVNKKALERRTAGAVFTATLVRHATLRLFVAEAIFGGRRHQQFLVLAASLLGALAVGIWLYYSHALQCCHLMRASLNCDINPDAPCHGYQGSCVMLREQYYRSAAPALSTADLIIHHWSSHQCHGFPDPTSSVHTLVSGLISFAVCVPIAQLASSCFSLAMATDEAQLRGSTRLMRWSLGRSALLLGRAPWGAQPGRMHAMRRRVAAHWCTASIDKLLVAVGAALERLAALLRRSWPRRRIPADLFFGRARPPKLNAAGVDGAERDYDAVLLPPPMTHDERTAAFERTGYVVVGICWACFVWTTLVYGRLVYNLLGGEAGDSFTRSWGVSVGLAQANDARDAAVTIVKSIATLLVLEAFWLLPNGAWLERTLDEASVHATLLRDVSATGMTRLLTYARFNKAVS
jgi:hypothetical protein